MTTEQVLCDALKQTDWPGAHDDVPAHPIHRYGCYARVLGLAAELRAGRVFSKRIFEETLHAAHALQRWDGKPVVSQDELTQHDPERFCQLCFDALAPQRFRVWQVGTNLGWFHRENWYHGPVTEDFSFLALHWGRPNPDGHWTYFDPYGSIAWDPHGGLRPLSPVPLEIVMYLVVEAV